MKPNANQRNHLNGLIIFLVLVSAPVVFFAAGSALGERDNQVRQWLPRGFAETKRYDWFLEHFGSEEFTLVSWEGATVDDDRVATMAELLRRNATAIEDAARSDTDISTRPHPDNRFLFSKIVTGPELLNQLQEGPLGLNKAAAVSRLQGTLLGSDGQTTGLLAMLSEEGEQDRHTVVATIHEAAANSGIEDAELKLGGPTIDSVALDQESERSRFRLALISFALGTLAAWKCLRQMRLVAVVLLTAVYCGAATLAWVHVFGDKLNLVMVTMPTLVYVLTISGAIHVTHYYRSALKRNNKRDAIRISLQAGWLPCTLTTLTTAVGLGSLVVSNVAPVRQFGFYSTLGVLTSLPIVLFFLPAVLSIILREGDTETTGRSASRYAERLTSSLSRLVARRHSEITVGGIVLMLFSVAGLTQLTTSVKLTNFFSPKSRVIADYRWLEENLAPLVPIELVLRLPEDDNSVRMVDRVALTAKVQLALKSLPAVEGAISAATFAPKIPHGGGMRQLVERKLIDKELRHNTDDLLASGYVGTDGAHQLWRISARVNALNDLDYGLFLDNLRNVVEPVLDDFRGEDTNQVDVVYTGVVPLIYKAQRVLLNDLTKSFLLAFGIIAVVMLIMMRGFAGGLVTMLPNIFPAVVVFGSLGWLGIVCDIGTVITASVALGIAVDDTIHFMSWFRRGLARGLTRAEAVHDSYRRCGMAMLQTTIICGLGMLGFVFSEFAPTAKFASLMGLLLCTALVGDLIFLPAILLSRLGKAFEPATKSTNRVWLDTIHRATVRGKLSPKMPVIHSMK